VSVVGIVAALTAEARTLGPVQPAPRAGAGSSVNILADGNLLVISGMGSAAAAQAARALVAAGAGALLSFGLAGALDPALPAGAVLLPASVIDGAGTAHATCAGWREQLGARQAARAGRGIIVDGALLSLAQPLTTLFEKSQARARSGALAVDMESFAIAQIALDLGVKFAAARVVVDTAADSLPAAVMQATGPRGEMDYPRLLAGLIRRPTEVLALLRLARRYQVALRSLRAVAGAGLGLS
jgi:adenosylhomocysteine nucleosidase